MGRQAGLLRSYFKNSYTLFEDNLLVWKGNITPTPLSQTYEVKIVYRKNKHPKVTVLDPKLTIPEGQEKLPHVHKDGTLCLYYHEYNEWNADSFIAKTIVPWASEWLYFYEIWLATGEWKGGGIEHNTSEK